MKHNFFIILYLFMILPGCDKKLEEINIDPTKLTAQNMQFNYLFTSAELSADGAGIFGSSVMYSSTMMQQLSSTSPDYPPGDKYIYDEGANGDFWQSQYSSSIKTIIDVIENIKQDENRKNLYNISRILKAFLFQRLTDMYGDIPYFDAGLGFINGSTSPKYDLQKDIYADLLGELEDAAQKLDATADNTVDVADLFYGGNVAKWKRFAYSEMLRLAMRMSKVDPGSAKTWSEKAVQGGVMESNDDNAICPHDAPNVSNPVGLQLVFLEGGGCRLSDTLINFLKDNDDPRLPYLATVSENPGDNTDLGDNNPSIQLGQPNGYDNRGRDEDITKAPNWPGDQNKYSVVNRTTFAREEAPTFILTYAETALLLAEAAHMGWISGDASDYYNKGVKAAILQLNQANQAGATISEAAADDYVSSHPYDAAKGLEMINTQYWVATFADWNETWFNWRRSGYPKLKEVHYRGAITVGSIPRRFTYPAGEAIVNPQNYKEAVERIAPAGGDKMTTRVWWDK